MFFKLWILMLMCLIDMIICSKSLVGVVAIHRHGNRNPIKLYKNDPHRNSEFWKIGLAELTDVGKIQARELGRFLRRRYDNFLPDEYNKSDIYVRSSDKDRTLMTVTCVLSELFPPKVLDTGLIIQPVPIHTVPLGQERLLLWTGCPKLLRMESDFLNRHLKTLNEKMSMNITEYVNQNAGEQYISSKDLVYFYDTLKLEAERNLEPPTWTYKVYPNLLDSLFSLSFISLTFSQKAKRLSVGLLWSNILDFFNAKLTDDPRKMLIFSAHDVTLTSIMNSIDVYDHKQPDYCSVLLLELSTDSDGVSYVDLFYKNGRTEIRQLELGGCGTNCDYDTFLNIITPMLVNEDEAARNCYT